MFVFAKSVSSKYHTIANEACSARLHVCGNNEEIVTKVLRCKRISVVPFASSWRLPSLLWQGFTVEAMRKMSLIVTTQNSEKTLKVKTLLFLIFPFKYH